MSGDIFGFHNWQEVASATGIWCGEAKDAANHPTMHRAAPHNEELSSPKCRQC